MIKNIENLADRLKGVQVNGEDLTPEKFIDLIGTDEEHELSVNEAHILNDDELKQAKSNSHREGIIFGTEKLVKSFRNVNELEFEGKIKYDNDGNVDFEKLAEHISNPLSERIKQSNTKPNEQLQEWQEKYNTIKSTYEQEKDNWENEKQNLSNNLKQVEIDTTLNSAIPELNGIKKQHAAMLFKSEYDVDLRDGQTIVKKGNEVVKDKLGNPLPLNDVINSFATENGWLKTPGRGEGNEGGNPFTFNSMQEAMNYLRKNNIDPTSDEGLKIIEEARERSKD